MAFTWHGRDHGGEMVWEQTIIRRKAVVKSEYEVTVNGQKQVIPVHREYRLSKKESVDLLRHGYITIRLPFWNGSRNEYVDVGIPHSHLELVEQEEYRVLKERPADPVALLESTKKKKK